MVLSRRLTQASEIAKRESESKLSHSEIRNFGVRWLAAAAFRQGACSRYAGWADRYYKAYIARVVTP